MSEASQSEDGASMPPEPIVLSDSDTEVELPQQPVPLLRSPTRRGRGVKRPDPPSPPSSPRAEQPRSSAGPVRAPSLEDLEVMAHDAASESADLIELRMRRFLEFPEVEPGARPYESTAKEFRFQGRSVAGTISRCALAPDKVMEQLLNRPGLTAAVAAGELHCLIVQELHEDGYPHLHFYLEVKKDSNRKLQIRGNKLSERYPYRMSLKAVYAKTQWLEYLFKEQEEENRLPPACFMQSLEEWRAASVLPIKKNPEVLTEAWPWLLEPTLEKAIDAYYKQEVKGDPKKLEKMASKIPGLTALWQIYSRADAVCKMLNERAEWLKEHKFGGLLDVFEAVAEYIDRYVRAASLEREEGTGQYSRQPVLVISGASRIGKTMGVLSLLAAASVSACLLFRGAVSPAELLSRKGGKIWTMVLDDLRSTQAGGPLLPPDKQWTQPPASPSTCEGKYVREGSAYDTPAGVIILTNSPRAELIANWQTPCNYWVDPQFGVFTANVRFVDLSGYSELRPLYTADLEDGSWLRQYFARWDFTPFEDRVGPAPNNQLEDGRLALEYAAGPHRQVSIPDSNSGSDSE